MAYRSSAPKLQDSDNNLLFKIAQSLNADPLAGDSANNLLRKIAGVAAAATGGGGGGDGTFTNLFSTNSTSTNGTFTNLTAVNGTIANLTAPNFNSSGANFDGPVVIAPTTNVVQLKLIDSPGQTVQALQIFQSDGVTQVFGVNFSGSTQIFRQAADTSGASLTHLKRGNTGDATAAIASGAQLSQDNYQGWDGSAFVNGAQVMVTAREAFTAIARGSQFEFRAAAVGGTALTLMATLNTSVFTLGTGMLLTFGGTTSSFPAIKANGANLELRFADDSNNTALISGYILASQNDANTAIVSAAVEAYHNTIVGTPAIGNGVAYDLSSDTDTVERRNMARISSTWTTITDATRTSNLNFRLINSSALITPLVLTPTSLNTIAGVGILLNGAAAVASMTGGIVLADSPAPSANPVAAVALYSSTGQFLYRTSAASEGAGQGNRVHNRALTVVGAGTDYALTTTSAVVDFGTTDAEVTLPTSGTYLILATIGLSAGASAVADLLSVKLRNITDAVDITEETIESVAVVGARTTSPLHVVITVNTLKVIQIFARNQTSANGSIVSTLTKLSFVRLS